MSYFSHIEPIRYQGPASDQPLSFRWYDKDRVVMGKRMEDHLRFAVCYWHTFAWTGGDPFGGDTFERPWFQGGTPMAPAERKAEQAFEFSPGWVRPTPVSMIGKWHPKATHRARATPTFGTWWNNWRDTSSARV